MDWLVVAGASFLLAACAATGDTSSRGRPLIYKQGPGDAPSTIEGKAGVYRKRSSSELEARSSAPEAAPAPAAPPAVVTAPEPPKAPAPAAPPPPRARPAPPETALAQAAPHATPQAALPGSTGPPDLFSRYTQASRYGDLLFVSGQIAIDLHDGRFDPTQDIETQTRRVLENIRAILESNRLTLANVVSTTVYLSNISRLPSMDRVYHGFFKGAPPARTVVEVSNLPRGALVEISVVAGR